MKRILFLLVIILWWTFLSNGQSIRKFEFSIIWGVGMQNKYHSKTEEFQKDLVGDVYKGKMKLTRKEKKSILQKIKAINFWNIPEKYTGTRPPSMNGNNKSVSIHPNPIYSIGVTLNGETHSVTWSKESIDMGEKGSYDDLNSLFKYVGSIIASHQEWKKSPPMRGGYMYFNIILL
jgi:hypothetical protein